MSLSANRYLEDIFLSNGKEKQLSWLRQQINSILSAKSKQKLYITYSLCANHFNADVTFDLVYEQQSFTVNTTLLEAARLYLLQTVLIQKTNFVKAVQQLIQVADKTELEAFLKHLYLLPNAIDYKFAGVEALRTNIATVFNAISQQNPYPGAYFNDAEWNQMYLKAAFMQQDLTKILDVDKRANKDLTRIILDYTHERWAAGRTIDPLFWRPVSKFIDGDVLHDLERLFSSANIKERKAATLVCQSATNESAKKLLKENNEFQEDAISGKLTWQNI